MNLTTGQRYDTVALRLGTTSDSRHVADVDAASAARQPTLRYVALRLNAR